MPNFPLPPTELGALNLSEPMEVTATPTLTDVAFDLAEGPRRCAARGRRWLDTYRAADDRSSDDIEALTDLLTDLMHLAGYIGDDAWDVSLDRARQHHSEEVREAAEADLALTSRHLCDEECGDDGHPRDGRIVREIEDERPMTGWVHPDHLPGVQVTTWDADAGDGLHDGAFVVQIDTAGLPSDKRLRICLNDGPAVWDGMPDEDNQPGRYADLAACRTETDYERHIEKYGR